MRLGYLDKEHNKYCLTQTALHVGVGAKYNVTTDGKNGRMTASKSNQRLS